MPWLASLMPTAPAYGPFNLLAWDGDALADTAVAPDNALPDTGVGLALERALSPPFVLGRDYGTRCSTVVLVEDSAITFVERRFGPEGVVLGESYERLPRP